MNISTCVRVTASPVSPNLKNVAGMRGNVLIHASAGF